MTRKSVCLLAVGSIAVVLVARLSVGMQSFHAVEVDAPEGEEIVSVLKEVYRLRTLVACDPSVDFRVLESVVVDTPDYPIDDHQKQIIAAALGEQAIRRAGYLTWMKAYYLSLRGASLGPTPAPPLGARPTVVPVIYCPTPPGEPKLDFKSIVMDGNHAKAQFDDGPALQEAVLVRINGRWFVAAIRPLQILF